MGLAHSEFLSWPDDDQDKALAWKRDQAERCGGCGTRRRDWEADRDAFVGHVEVCPGCERVAQEHENVATAAKAGHDTKGVRVGLVTAEVAAAMEAAGIVDPLGA